MSQLHRPVELGGVSLLHRPAEHFDMRPTPTQRWLQMCNAPVHVFLLTYALLRCYPRPAKLPEARKLTLSWNCALKASSCPYPAQRPPSTTAGTKSPSTVPPAPARHIRPEDDSLHIGCSRGIWVQAISHSHNTLMLNPSPDFTRQTTRIDTTQYSHTVHFHTDNTANHLPFLYKSEATIRMPQRFTSFWGPLRNSREEIRVIRVCFLTINAFRCFYPCGPSCFPSDYQRFASV